MDCKHWDLFDHVHADDGEIYIPFDWVGNGTSDAYAVMVGEDQNDDGSINKHILRDFCTQFDDETITIAEYNQVVMENWTAYNLNEDFLIAEQEGE